MDAGATKQITNNAGFVFSPDGPYWKSVNKLIRTHMLSTRTLKMFLTAREEDMEAFVKDLAENSLRGDKVNLNQEIMKLINCVACRMMFGVRLQDVGSEGNEAFKGLGREVTEISGQLNLADFFWLCKFFNLHGIKKRIEGLHRMYDLFIESIITNREDLKREEKRKLNYDDHGDIEQDMRCFLDFLLDYKDDECSEIKITRDDMKGLLLDLISAATDTSSISIDWTLAELMNNPSVLKKAQEEIDRVIGKDRLVRESDIRNLPYLQAIVKESLRLHPPVSIVTRRSNSSCEVSGYHIPENTLVFLNISSIGRDPNVWESPMDFHPERFLPTDHVHEEFSVLRGHNLQLFSFGNGRRGCPGVNLALQVVPTVVAILIQCFEWKLGNVSIESKVDGMIDMGEKSGLTTPRASDIICVPLLRLDSSLILGVDSRSEQE